MLFTTLVILFLLLKHKWTMIIVKCWALLSGLAGLIGIFSVVVSILLGGIEDVKLTIYISHLIHFVFGGIIFFFWDHSVTAYDQLG